MRRSSVSFMNSRSARPKMPESTKASLKQFHNCRILRHGNILLEDLWVRDGKIIDPEKIFYDEKVEPDVRIDCKGALISPGFIDVQINGMLLSEF